MVSQSNTVHVSKDYEAFSFLGANREQYRGHVENLKKAFQEMGNLTQVQPILVNENFAIIDGQHRFTAAKELGEPIYFTQLQGLTVQDARMMNNLHRGWTTQDYIDSYATTDGNYAKLKTLQEEYGFAIGIVLTYVRGDTGKGYFQAMRNGSFVMPADIAAIRQRLDDLSELVDVFPPVQLRNAAIPLLQIMRNENYNQKRMVSKLAQHGPGHWKAMSNAEDNLRQLEELYNRNQPEASRVRLY